MKKVAILGSTGSIGVSALDVVDSMEVVALAASKSVSLMEEQVRRFEPKYAALSDEGCAADLKRRVADTPCKILSGEEALTFIAAETEADIVLGAMSGFCGLKPTLAAIQAGKRIALANKETIVAAGEIVLKLAAKNQIIPVDSEHSAIFQAIGQNEKFLKKIILTASGGPFFGRTDLEKVTVEEALRHPSWNMGQKITIDSATLMNKGLEVIEAMHLFNISADNIEVVVHRESIVHSMVEFSDNVVMAQLGAPDMRAPISYGFNFPDRVETPVKSISFAEIGALTFKKPDIEAFLALPLCIAAAKSGGTVPAVLNAANEVAVSLFLKGKLSFTGIAELTRRVIDRHSSVANPALGDVFDADAWAREEALGLAGDF